MNIFLTRATFLATATCFVSALVASAQGNAGTQRASVAQPRAPLPDRIAAVDINYIFKNHPRFENMLKDLKKDADAIEANLKSKRLQIQNDAKKLQTYNVSSPEYKQLEERIARMQSELQVDAQLKKKEFLQRESKIYYEVYREIKAVVKNLADRYGFAMVVRFNSRPINADNPRDIQMGVLRPIVHVRHDINITQPVLQMLGGVAKNTSRRPAGNLQGGSPQPGSRQPAGRSNNLQR